MPSTRSPRSSYSYSREAACLPEEVEELNRMVPLCPMFITESSVVLREVRKWLEAGAPPATAPTARLRRAAYRQTSLANPDSKFTWATFTCSGMAIDASPGARTLYKRLALDWPKTAQREQALLLHYGRDQVGRIHTPGEKEAAGFPKFNEVSAGEPFGLTTPNDGLDPLPEVVHDHWPGSGEIMAEPLRDPRPIGVVEPYPAGDERSEDE